jgi:hypothetical protein
MPISIAEIVAAYPARCDGHSPLMMIAGALSEKPVDFLLALESTEIDIAPDRTNGKAIKKRLIRGHEINRI